MRALPADCRLIHPTENAPYRTARTPEAIASHSATSVDMNFPPEPGSRCMQLVVESGGEGRAHRYAPQPKTRKLSLAVYIDRNSAALAIEYKRRQMTAMDVV